MSETPTAPEATKKAKMAYFMAGFLLSRFLFNWVIHIAYIGIITLIISHEMYMPLKEVATKQYREIFCAEVTVAE